MKKISAVLAILPLFFLVASPAYANFIERVSVGNTPLPPEEEFNSSSATINQDGRYVAFLSDNVYFPTTASCPGIFVRDRQTNTTEQMNIDSDGNELCQAKDPISISSDGRFVAFNAGDNNIYVRDRVNQTNELVSVSDDGTPANSFTGNPYLSGDGRYVLFASQATNLDSTVTVPNTGKELVYLRDRTNNTTRLVSIDQNGNFTGGPYDSDRGPSISDDGRYVVWFGKDSTNSINAIYIRDLTNNVTTQLNQGRFTKVSRDGSTVVENTTTGIMLYNTADETSELLPFDDSSRQLERSKLDISDNGRYIALVSPAVDNNQHEGIYRYDKQMNETKFVSYKSDGTYDDEWGADEPAMSGGGQFIAFETEGQYSPDDLNQFLDVYLRDMSSAPPTVADLQIDMSDSPDPITPKNELTYTIMITNKGPISVNNITMTDILPTGPSFVSETASQGQCTGTTTVTCNLGTLTTGTSATVSIVVKPTDIGTFQNTASVAADETDPNISNNSITEGTTVASAQDLTKLRVAVQGNGTVTSNPTGISCHPNCTNYFYPGTQVTLTAVPLPGYSFIGWDFDCASAGTNPACTLTANSNITARAKFTRR